MEGMVPECQQDGTWVYPLIGEALAKVGLDEIGVYITCHQNTSTQYIATRPIMYLFLTAERRLRVKVLHKWWEQPTLDILGIREEHPAA